MSYNHPEIIWTENTPESVSVGYEVEFSLRSSYGITNYKVTTYEEIKAEIGKFFYSLDNGETWVAFPKAGKIFYDSYQMKLVINVAEGSYVYAEKYGTVYKISGNLGKVLDQYIIGSFDSSSFTIDKQNNLYISGQNKTLYKISTKEELGPGDSSLNIHSNPLGIVIDGSRKSFWQVDDDVLYYKRLNGDIIFRVKIG